MHIPGQPIQLGNDESGAALLTGGPVDTLAAGLLSPCAVTVDAEAVYWTESGIFSTDVWTGDGAVKKLVHGDSVPVVLAGKQAGACGIAVDATDVYWSQDGGTRFPVRRVPRGGGTPVTLTPTDGPSAQSYPTRFPLGVALDATHVYFLGQSPKPASPFDIDALLRQPKSSCAGA